MVQNFSKAELVEFLKTQRNWVVDFIKVDGTTRSMRCTLDPALLPEQPELTEAKAPRAESEEVVRVFDTEKQAWRSFRLDKVVGISFVANEEDL